MILLKSEDATCRFSYRKNTTLRLHNLRVYFLRPREDFFAHSIVKFARSSVIAPKSIDERTANGERSNQSIVRRRTDSAINSISRNFGGLTCAQSGATAGGTATANLQ